MIIVGGEEVAIQLYSYFKSDNFLGVKLLAIFSDSKSKINIDKNIYQSTLDDIKKFVKKNNVDEIYYTLPLSKTKKLKDLISFCDKQMIRFKLVPDFRGFLFKRVNIDFDDVPIITIREEPLTDFMNRLIKII